MKFIVEDELRDQYNRSAFTNFALTDDTRLTPEARQFLIDKKVNIELKNVSTEHKVSDREQNLAYIYSKIQKNLSIFWLVNSLILEKNQYVSNKLMELALYFEKSYLCFKEGEQLPDLRFLKVKEIKVEKHNNLITTLFIQSIGGQEIILLNYLGCSIEETKNSLIQDESNKQFEALCTNFEYINLQIDDLIGEVMKSYEY